MRVPLDSGGWAPDATRPGVTTRAPESYRVGKAPILCPSCGKWAERDTKADDVECSCGGVTGEELRRLRREDLECWRAFPAPAEQARQAWDANELADVLPLPARAREGAAGLIGRFALDAILEAPPERRPDLEPLIELLLLTCASDAAIAAAIRRQSQQPPVPTETTDTRCETDLLADHHRGMEAILRSTIVPSWSTVPGDRDYPTLGTEREMGQAAALLLAGGDRPWRVVRSLARTWPEWSVLLPELVREVVEQAQRSRREAQ